MNFITGERMIKAVIFDMDGTIVDTLDDLTDAVNYMLGLHNMPLRSKIEIKSFVGDGIPKLIERSLPSIPSDKELEKYTEEMLNYYIPHSMDKTAPYDGIIELLKELKNRNILTAVVTNKEETAAKKIVNEMFLNLFDVVVGARENLPSKPAPDGVNLALAELSITDKNEAVYIGDSDVDAKTAFNAELSFIAALWGFRDKDVLEKAGATVFASVPADVLNIIA